MKARERKNRQRFPYNKVYFQSFFTVNEAREHVGCALRDARCTSAELYRQKGVQRRSTRRMNIQGPKDVVGAMLPT